MHEGKVGKSRSGANEILQGRPQLSMTCAYAWLTFWILPDCNTIGVTHRIGVHRQLGALLCLLGCLAGGEAEFRKTWSLCSSCGSTWRVRKLRNIKLFEWLEAATSDEPQPQLERWVSVESAYVTLLARSRSVGCLLAWLKLFIPRLNGGRLVGACWGLYSALRKSETNEHMPM